MDEGGEEALVSMQQQPPACSGAMWPGRRGWRWAGRQTGRWSCLVWGRAPVCALTGPSPSAHTAAGSTGGTPASSCHSAPATPTSPLTMALNLRQLYLFLGTGALAAPPLLHRHWLPAVLHKLLQERKVINQTIVQYSCFLEAAVTLGLISQSEAHYLCHSMFGWMCKSYFTPK